MTGDQNPALSASRIHACSAGPETCPHCGHESTRDEFEGFEAWPEQRGAFFVRCPKCEEPHPDQSNHDARNCDTCATEGFDG